MNPKKKQFDCLKMKRAIQEHLYQETRAMNPDEYKAYIRNRIATSQFASFLDKTTTISNTPR